MEPYFQYFVVGRGTILAQLDTLPEAAEAIRLREDPGIFLLECKANLRRPVGGLGLMAEIIGFPAWRHSPGSLKAEWALAREGCVRVAGMLVMGNEGRWLEAEAREAAARERMMAVAGRV